MVAARPSFEVSCPHCGKPFQANLIEGPASRYRGYKCPHCNLFVPAERADEQSGVDLDTGNQ